MHPAKRYCLELTVNGVEGLRVADAALGILRSNPEVQITVREVKALERGERVEDLPYSVTAEIVSGGETLFDAVLRSGKYSITMTAVS